MNGAEALIQTCVDSGVEICFANPGTTEMQLVAALDSVDGMRGVLGLFEGVCTGAADGYARVSGRPAATLLHLGPGFSNGIANLHNARRARSPVVNIVGDHATWHRAADAPLSSDIMSLASPVSVWTADVTTAQACGPLATEAVARARHPLGGPVTLVVAQDATWHDGGEPAAPLMPETAGAFDDEQLDAAVSCLSDGGALLLGGDALEPDALFLAEGIRAATGARVLIEVFPARQHRGLGLPEFDRLPYFPEQAVEALEGPGVVLGGARSPVAFFGYPDRVSRLVDDDATVPLAPPGVDVLSALTALAAGVGASNVVLRERESAVAPTGELGVGSLGAAVAATLPERSIVVDEAATSGLGFGVASGSAPPHVSLHLSGGAIGQGLPNAVGAALAAPDKRVVALQADGSGMYTLQSLWTMAREQLDVTVVVCANHAYRILQFEYGRATESLPGPQALDLMQLERPTIDWTALATAQGVPSTLVDTADALVDELRRAHAAPGPTLIEAVLE